MNNAPSAMCPRLSRLLRVAPLLLAISAGTAQAGLAIALNSAEGTVSLIDTDSYKTIGKETACKEPHHLIASLDDQSVIVACAAANQLVYFDPRTGKEKQRIRNISDPYHLGFSPDRKWFLSISLRLDRVDIYSADKLELKARLPAPRTPSHVTFDAASQFAFVTLQDSNEVMAIDLNTMKRAWVMPVGPTPAGILMSPDDKHLMVGIMGEGYVEIIDWRNQKTVKKVPTGKAAHNLHPKGDGRHYFVSNRTMDGSISVLDTHTMSIVGRYDVPGGPDDMEVRADGTELWATARFARKVQVIDLSTGKLKASIPVGSSPHGVFFLGHGARK